MWHWSKHFFWDKVKKQLTLPAKNPQKSIKNTQKTSKTRKSRKVVFWVFWNVPRDLEIPCKTAEN
jgi:hypothetical protein